MKQKITIDNLKDEITQLKKKNSSIIGKINKKGGFIILVFNMETAREQIKLYVK